MFINFAQGESCTTSLSILSFARKMNTFWVFVVVSALAVVSCDDGAKDPELEAVQQKLRKLELIEKFIAAIPTNVKKAEQRDDCLAYGEECFMISGPDCCGFSNWCNYHDEYIPGDANNPPRYVNRCRAGSLTVMLEEVYNNTIGRK
ncbi:hypothetical protein X975_23421, partial [Stegodyphus mimosarum]